MQYISASRRNDLPRFHYRKFFHAWKLGSITYDGGYGRSYTVSLKREDVFGYIFWSKDYARFIAQPEFDELIASNNAIFHYTINNLPELEPNVPLVKQQVETLGALCEKVGAERVLWRFDPVCRYVCGQCYPSTTEEAFFNLIPLIAELGITRCYFSFMSLYSKTKNRTIQFLPFSEEQKIRIASSMLKAAQSAGMTLYNCCNEEVLGLVPGIQKASCVDEEILKKTDRFGVHKSLKPGTTRNGCGCFKSRDIGSYNPACGHGCLYCYANPTPQDLF
jgi:DNA repair photolyase